MASFYRHSFFFLALLCVFLLLSFYSAYETKLKRQAQGKND